MSDRGENERGAETGAWEAGAAGQWQARHKRSLAYYHGRADRWLDHRLGSLARNGLARLAALLVAVAVVLVFFAWYGEADERRLARQHQAWTVIHLAGGLPGDAGRRGALEDLRALGADLRGAPLAGADLSGSSLRRARLDRADLAGASLAGADLYRAQLRGADLARANLAGADLSLANLAGAGLAGAELLGAALHRTILRDVRAAGASFQKARLAEADLRDADLSGADLWLADLSGADMGGLDLTDANLLGVRVERRALDRARLCRTTMSNGEVESRDC